MGEALVSHLRDFIAFASTDANPSQKQECIDWLRAGFFSTDVHDLQTGVHEGDAPYLYAKHPHEKLLVFAHVDVVPAPDELFSLRIEGDKAWGRGVADMKGPILPFLLALRDAHSGGENPPVSVLITTDEEIVGTTIPALLDGETVKTSVAFTPDSSDIGFVTEHKGVCWSELVVHGKGGHGAMPWDTENPAWLLGQALEAIREAFPAGSHDDWQMTASPTTLQGSSARNQVAEHIVCGLDIRFPPGVVDSADDALAKVRAVLPDGCELREVQRASPLLTDAEHPMVQLVKSTAEDVMKKPIPFVREHGGTDARYFSERGIPAFLYGPEGGGIHSDSEWVSLSSLEKHYAFYTSLFERLQSAV